MFEPYNNNNSVQNAMWNGLFFGLLLGSVANRPNTRTGLVKRNRIIVWLWWAISVFAFGAFVFYVNEAISSTRALVVTFIGGCWIIISMNAYFCRYMKHMHVYIPMIPFILYVCMLVKYVPFNNDIFPISFVGSSVLFAIFYKIAMIYHAKDAKMMAQEAEDKMIKDIERKEKMEELKKKGWISEDYDVQ